MTPDAIRHVVLFHGIAAWLGALSLALVAGTFLRNVSLDKPWLRALALLASVMTIGAFVSGVLLDEHYRVHLRQRLFLSSRALGWLFERKMHLSFGAMIFAVVASLMLFAMRSDARFFRSARASYALAAICALSSCVISSIVRSR